MTHGVSRCYPRSTCSGILVSAEHAIQYANTMLEQSLLPVTLGGEGWRDQLTCELTPTARGYASQSAASRSSFLFGLMPRWGPMEFCWRSHTATRSGMHMASRPGARTGGRPGVLSPRSTPSLGLVCCMMRATCGMRWFRAGPLGGGGGRG